MLKKILVLLAVSFLSFQALAECGVPKSVPFVGKNGKIGHKRVVESCPPSEYVPTAAQIRAQEEERRIKRLVDEQIKEYNREHPPFGSKGFHRLGGPPGVYYLTDVATGKSSTCFEKTGKCSDFF